MTLKISRLSNLALLNSQGWNKPFCQFCLAQLSLPHHVIIYSISGGSKISCSGRQLPRQLRFEKFVCQNERIWTLGGARAGGTPLDPPMSIAWII